MINTKTSTWKICEGHTIIKTVTENTGAYTTHPYKQSGWETHIICTCGWISGHETKLSNKLITQVHNQLFNIKAEATTI